MYNFLKQIINNVFPKQFIAKHKAKLRKVVAVFYKGSEYSCNICEFKMRKFITSKNGLMICPKCGSLSRTRQLWEVINTEVKNKVILHFSPTLALKHKLEQSDASNYVSTDYEGEFEADKTLNIEAIDEPDTSFDIAICYHVLEHVNNDIKAMSELYRILKPNGICYIQTPFKDGDIYEDTTITKPEDRLQHFGQEDHVRVYSIKGLKSRLESVGFTVKVKNTGYETGNTFGFSEEETIIIATKPFKLKA